MEHGHLYPDGIRKTGEILPAKKCRMQTRMTQRDWLEFEPFFVVRKFTQVAWKNCYKTIYHGQSAALKNAGPQVLRGCFIAHDRKTDSRGWVHSSGWMLDARFLAEFDCAHP